MRFLLIFMTITIPIMVSCTSIQPSQHYTQLKTISDTQFSIVQ